MAVLTIGTESGSPADSMRERQTDNDVFNDAMVVGEVSGVEFGLGLRFGTVPADLVQGSTINSATLGWSARTSTGAGMTCEIKAERSATPAQFTTCTNSCASVSGRTYTTAAVSAVQADFGEASLSQSLVSILQEVVDNFDPAGNAFVIWLRCTSNVGGTNNVQIGSGSTSGATLTVTYTPPAAGGVSRGPVTVVLSALLGGVR